eukprot:TRINITY_DN2577_c0_g1_i1.p1 TRINITY_DN2577_c0_g1~~TRINITY_DN2577_c0_g1_i1.p1  ORF type:complete len:678 (+),score=95.21 TRINITY_DN2577_c0_g1_i1:124-2157(+)
MIWRTFILLALLSASSSSCKTGKKGSKASKTTTTLAPITKSCEGKCLDDFNQKDPCQCNKQCSSRENCCDDYVDFCTPQTSTKATSSSSKRGSCQGKCNSPFDRKKSCQCNANCNKFSNCCSDFDTLCKVPNVSTTEKPKQSPTGSPRSSCTGRCNEKFKGGSSGCRCNSNCNRFNNCCSDFNSTCFAPLSTPNPPTKSPNLLTGSCSGKCHQPFSFKNSCQCNYGCEEYNNCCPDYVSLCSSLPPPNNTPKRPTGASGGKSCLEKCNQPFQREDECQCNSNCNRFNNCCSDFNSTCLAATPSKTPGSRPIKSCRGKCNELVHSRDSCQCNPTCEKFNSCCPDYAAECKAKVPVPITKSCARRCNTKFKPGDVCQCNPNCHQFDNCCPDYDAICENPIIHSDNVVTDEELKSISEHLLKNDVNNAGRSININSQERKHGCNNQDVAPRRLFTSVHSSVWDIPTIKTLVALLDNYDPNVRVNEDETPQELREQKAFMNSILATPVMNATYYFLRQNGAFTGSKGAFRETLSELWFGIYDRDGDSRVRTLGSSGFEHVFVGELKNNEVGGFHHWVFFVLEEQKGNVEYLGKRGEISLGQYGKGFTGSFLWKNQVKCTGSMTVGTSPELDMALYTICAMARPNADCKMSLNRKKVTIKAFEFSYRGRTHIGTAFPNFRQK